MHPHCMFTYMHTYIHTYLHTLYAYTRTQAGTHMHAPQFLQHAVYFRSIVYSGGTINQLTN